jgi:hypothetical protein
MFFKKLSRILTTIIFTLDRMKEKIYNILFYVLCNKLYAFIFIDFLILLNSNPIKKVKIRKFLIIGGVTPPTPPPLVGPALKQWHCISFFFMQHISYDGHPQNVFIYIVIHTTIYLRYYSYLIEFIF